MYCHKCGQSNPDDALYCKKCGAQIDTDAEVETRVAPRSGGVAAAGDGPRKIFVISPTLKFVFAGYILAVLTAFLLVVALTLLIPGFVPAIGVVIGFVLLLVPVYYHIRQRLTRYALTETTIEIDRGLIARSTQNIPLRRVQDVTVTATLFQRILGYGDITIDNASEDGGKIILDNVDTPRRIADTILRQMRELDR